MYAGCRGVLSVVLLLFAMLAIPLHAVAEEGGNDESAFKADCYRLSRVIDGDSIQVRGLDRDVRLAGINAPEWDAAYGREATDALGWLLGDYGRGQVCLEPAEVSYDSGTGRYRAYVWVSGDVLAQEFMAWLGLAKVDHEGPWKSTWYYEYLASAEADAAHYGCYIWGGEAC